MCGICGYIDYRGSIEGRRSTLQAMNDLLDHRGPDEQGLHLEGGIGLGHRRLSIIDLSSGQQPMGSLDGSQWLVFNGEIYNFRELRNELTAKGFVFRTKSDTEVILQGYAAWGDDVVKRLDGMFVFALWDARRKRMLAARDRLGKKPLYYYAGPDRFLFASELKSILAEKEVPREVDPAAVDRYFTYGYIPAPLTIFKGIAKLRPGHILVWEDGKTDIKPYWDVRYNPRQRDETQAVDELEGLLQDAVRKRLISDVPLGAFLSGGLDSSTVVALMSRISGPGSKTFTIGFEQQEFSEVDDARLISKVCGTEHHEQTVKADALSVLPGLVWHLDEPFSDSSSVPTFYVSQMARRNVTVVLSGDGGDELFAGYNNYAKSMGLGRWQSIPRPIRKHLMGAAGKALPISAPGKFWLLEQSRLEEIGESSLVEIFPPVKDGLFSRDYRRQLQGVETPEAALAYWEQAASLPKLSRMQYLDTKVYLAEDILMKVDKMSMANSLETRAPLLDTKVVEFAATLTPDLLMRDGKGKYLLRKVAERILPASVLNKKKQGFAIPRSQWFRKELRDFAWETLGSPGFAARGYFHGPTVQTMLIEHDKGKRDYSHWIWALLNFEIWHQTFMDPGTRKV